MRSCELKAPDFNLDQTLRSGQVFHWEKNGEEWEGLIGGFAEKSKVSFRQNFISERAVKIRQVADRLYVKGANAKEISRYFSLDHSLPTIYQSFPADTFSQAAVVNCRGLRILRQPLWECLATFLFSSMKQVAHIRKISLFLREHYGEKISFSKINAFPSPERIADLDEASLRACGLGYRAKNFQLTARAVASGDCDLELLKKLPTSELGKSLQALPGIGPKVAACVMLFAYERLECVPVDVWIDRVIRLQLDKKKTAKLSKKDREKFIASLGAYAGYLQQYWFHSARIHGALETVKASVTAT
ncbi:MAG: DNA-3-methyladenine glycosylase family protein [Chthoniobacterales bacterium]